MNYDGTITLSTSVTDIARSIKWFDEVLGFKEIFQAPEAGWAEVSSPVDGVTIGLSLTETRGTQGTTPVLGVTDIVAAKQELESKGVKFEGDIEDIPGMVKLATFFDPDGNTFMLAESAQ